MVSRGGVAPFDGDLDDYQRYLLDEAKRLRAEATVAAQTAIANAKTVVEPPPTAAPIASREQRKEDAQLRKEINEKKRPLKKELEAVEKSMGTLETEKTSLHNKLATPLPPNDIAEAGKRLKAVDDELATLEMRWLELTEALDAIENTLA
jgi:ATP-binding cassette subfamily F protein 3